jgi:hypothetical protein
MESLAKVPSQEPTGFLHLPFELRLQVYYNCLPHKTIFNVTPVESNFLKLRHEDRYLWFEGYDLEFFESVPDWMGRPGDSALPGLLQVSRQISDEALNVLYGDNLFDVSPTCEGEQSPKTRFSDANRRRMNSLLLTSWRTGPCGIQFFLT